MSADDIDIPKSLYEGPEFRGWYRYEPHRVRWRRKYWESFQAASLTIDGTATRQLHRPPVHRPLGRSGRPGGGCL